MNTDTYKSNIVRDCTNYLQLLRQHQVNKNKVSIANPYNPKQNNKTYRQNNHTATTTIIGTNGYDLNQKINIINTTTHSTLELDNKGRKLNEQNLNCRNNSTIRSNDNPTESDNKTTTPHTTKNSESVPKLCNSDRNGNSTKNNEIIQRKKTSDIHKRDSIKVTTTAKSTHYIRKQKQTKQQNVIERTGTVRKSKNTTTVGRNIYNFYRSKHEATKKDNVPQQTVITPSDDST